MKKLFNLVGMVIITVLATVGGVTIGSEVIGRMNDDYEYVATNVFDDEAYRYGFDGVEGRNVELTEKSVFGIVTDYYVDVEMPTGTSYRIHIDRDGTQHNEAL